MKEDYASRLFLSCLADWSQYYMMFYVYAMPTTANLTGNSSGVSVPQQLTIQQDRPFVILGTSGTVWAAAMLNFSGSLVYAPKGAIFDIYAQFYDLGSSNFLFSSSINIGELIGESGKDRMSWPVPYMLEQNTTLQQTLTSFDTRTLNVDVSLWGAKIAQRKAQLTQMPPFF